MRWQRGPLESCDFGENGVFCEFGRTGNYSPKSPNCKLKFKRDGKGALWKVAISAKMAYLAKMAEMAIIRQIRQTVSKNSNEMAKGPFGKWQFRRKWRIWRKWQKWRFIAKIAKL